MARKSRDKGNRRELEFAALIGGKRVPLSGMGHEKAADEFSGDVIGPDGKRWEVKARADGFKQLYAWLQGKGGLALKADGKPWLIVTRLEVKDGKRPEFPAGSGC